MTLRSDYGEEWEDAWNKHVASWRPLKAPESWITAKEANMLQAPILDELMSGDLRETVDHPYLFTGCQYEESHFDEHPVYTDTARPGDWRDMGDNEIMSLYSDPFEILDLDVQHYAIHRDGTHWPCTVIGPDDENGWTYTVRIHPSPYSYPPWEKYNKPRLIRNYPLEAIHYFVRRFQSDQHLPNAFRHPIGIRDEIFPPQWKNLKVEKSDEDDESKSN